MSVTSVMQFSPNCHLIVLDDLVIDNLRNLQNISNSFASDDGQVDPIKQRLNAHLNANVSSVPTVKFDISFSVTLSAISCQSFE